MRDITAVDARMRSLAARLEGERVRRTRPRPSFEAPGWPELGKKGCWPSGRTTHGRAFSPSRPTGKAVVYWGTIRLGES
jgi:hypothetical protein